MTELAPIADVTLLELVYREHHNERHTGLMSVLDDLASFPGEISFATLMGSAALTELDWELVADLERPGHLLAIAWAVNEDDPRRAEALLHALPPNGVRSYDAWAAEFNARWSDVRAAMR
jgi:hypothetical protein